MNIKLLIIFIRKKLYKKEGGYNSKEPSSNAFLRSSAIFNARTLSD